MRTNNICRCAAMLWGRAWPLALLKSSWECWKRTCSLLHLRVRHLCFTNGLLTMCLAFGFSERSCWLFFAHPNKAHRRINFTYRVGTEVDFMDSSLSITGDSISSDLYTEPTDTHQYLLPSSDHPPHVHKHLSYGLGICTG